MAAFGVLICPLLDFEDFQLFSNYLQKILDKKILSYLTFFPVLPCHVPLLLIMY